MIDGHIALWKQSDCSPKNIRSSICANNLQSLQRLSAMRSCVIKEISMHRVPVCLDNEPADRKQPSLARCQSINAMSINLFLQQLQRWCPLSTHPWAFYVESKAPVIGRHQIAFARPEMERAWFAISSVTKASTDRK